VTRRDALARRLSGAALAAYELLTVHFGDRLGLYGALAELEGATSAELAEVTETHERYARAWLEQQAVAGILHVDDPAAAPGARRYRLSEGHAEVLVDRDSLAHVTPMARDVASFASVLPALEKAFRTGGGVPQRDYGALGREAQADSNRALFLSLLGSEWLPAIPDVHERLLADPPARVADVARGAGWSSIAIARAYPKVAVDGYDLDEDSIVMARANAAGAGLETAFASTSATQPTPSSPAPTSSSSCSRPCTTCHTPSRSCARCTVSRRPTGRCSSWTSAWRTSSRPPATRSSASCTPTASSAASRWGSRRRPPPERARSCTETLRGYAAAAGFASVEVHPIEHETFRFYRLHR
jgi:hypothetical protein